MSVARLGIILALVVAGSARGDLVDHAVAAQMAERHIPGLALAIIQDGRIVREQGYGFRDVEKHLPITAETICQSASVS